MREMDHFVVRLAEWETTGGEIFDDAAYYADLLVKYKAIIFKNLRPSREEHIKILEVLYQGTYEDLRWGERWDEDHKFMFEGDLASLGDMMPEDRKAGWHSDMPTLDQIPSLQSMHMTKFDDIPEGTGRTWLLDLEQLYAGLSLHQKEWLQTATVTHGQPADEGLATVTPHPEASDLKTYPAIRIHPVTGNKNLFISGPENTPTPNDETAKEVQQVIWDAMSQYDKPDSLRYAHEWEVGDLMVWDNRNLLHTFEGGWKYGSRIFDKVEYGYETPLF